MILFFILIFCLILASFKGIKGYNEYYLSYDMTNAVKGIFILLVFMRHANQYILGSGYDFNSYGDALLLNINSCLGQSIVTLFLFYSGYGVMESIKKKGDEYITSFPRKRVLSLLINFDIAVLLYVFVVVLLNNHVTVKQCILSLFAWESVGNSNWYIFVIQICYISTWLVFYISRKTLSNSINYKTISALIVLLLATMVCLSYCKEEYWYDTILCYGAGCLFSLKRMKYLISLRGIINALY